MTILKRCILILFLALLTSAGLRLPVYADPLTDPTHFDDTYWTWPNAPSGYTQLDTDITPEADGSPDGYYFSSGFWFTGDPQGYGGYMGLQTEGDNPTGKIAVFSIWGATSSSGPGYNASGTEVGATYYTSRISYPWTVNNTYDIRIALTSQSSGGNTWTATVIDQTSGVQSLVGNIVTPTSMGNLLDQSYTFHERYAGDTSSCGSLILSEVKFTNLTANNGAVTPSSHSNVAPTNSACAADFATRDIAGGIETIIGGQFPAAAIPSLPASPKPTPSPAPTITTPVVTTPSPAVSTPSPTPIKSPMSAQSVSKPETIQLKNTKRVSQTERITVYSLIIIAAVALYMDCRWGLSVYRRKKY